MKRIFSFVIAFSLILSSLCFVADAETVKGERFLGDVNNDGKVLSDDARTVLRAAVGLDDMSAWKK